MLDKQMVETSLLQQNQSLNIKQIMRELNEKSSIISSTQMSKDLLLETFLKTKEGDKNSELSSDQNDMEFRRPE